MASFSVSPAAFRSHRRQLSLSRAFLGVGERGLGALGFLEGSGLRASGFKGSGLRVRVVEFQGLHVLGVQGF